MIQIDTSEDKLHEECGVFGIFGSPDASTLTALGLHALQHRGQEGAGIVTFDGEKFDEWGDIKSAFDYWSENTNLRLLELGAGTPLAK